MLDFEARKLGMQPRHLQTLKDVKNGESNEIAIFPPKKLPKLNRKMSNIFGGKSYELFPVPPSLR